MKYIFFLFALALPGFCCSGPRTLIEPTGEITEGDAKIVKLQPNEGSEKTTGTQSGNSSQAQEQPSRSWTNEELSPEAKALLEEMKKEEKESASAREKKLKELEAEIQKRSDSAAELAKADACVVEGNKLFDQKNYQEAAQKYKEALDHYPLHKEALAKLAECHKIMALPKEEKEGEGLAPSEERLLLSQKFAASERLFAENSLEEAGAKFREVIDMITWSKKKLDTENYLQRAREYLEKIEAKKKEPSQQSGQEEKPQK
jgi:tetratricopeptide (TPR) repeat protein